MTPIQPGRREDGPRQRLPTNPLFSGNVCQRVVSDRERLQRRGCSSNHEHDCHAGAITVLDGTNCGSYVSNGTGA
jgi:hypothetical protein